MRTAIVVYASRGVRITTLEENIRFERLHIPEPAGLASGAPAAVRVEQQALGSDGLDLEPGVYRAVSKRALSVSCAVTGAVVIADCRDKATFATIGDDTDVVIVSCEGDLSPSERDIVPEPPTRSQMAFDKDIFARQFRRFFWDGEAGIKVAITSPGGEAAPSAPAVVHP